MATRPGKRVRLYALPSKGKDQVYERKRSDDLYHTWRWTKESRAFRFSNPLCAECERSGIIKASEVVDHIIPYPVCKDFWDQSNWQALCTRCNADKGNRDKKIINKYKQNHG